MVNLDYELGNKLFNLKVKNIEKAILVLDLTFKSNTDLCFEYDSAKLDFDEETDTEKYAIILKDKRLDYDIFSRDAYVWVKGDE